MLQNLTEANEEMQKKCEEMKGKLEDAVEQMDKMTDEYTMLRVCVPCFVY